MMPTHKFQMSPSGNPMCAQCGMVYPTKAMCAVHMVSHNGQSWPSIKLNVKRRHMLKCPIPKCRASVNGLTGHDELQKFGKHLRKVHDKQMGMEELLEFRVMAEKKQEMTQEQFLEWLAEGP